MLIFWQENQSEISPQFVLGTVIGLKLLSGIESAKPSGELNEIIGNLLTIEQQYHKKGGKNRF